MRGTETHDEPLFAYDAVTPFEQQADTEIRQDDPTLFLSAI